MSEKIKYPYLNHKGDTYSSIEIIDRSPDIELDHVTNYRELVIAHLEEKIPFVICDKSGNCYNDVVFADFTANDSITFICKWLNPGYTKEIPTFGSVDSKTGLVQVTIPYDKLSMFIQMNPDPNGEMMMRLKEEHPDYYNYWMKTNKEEMCQVEAFMAPKTHG